MDSIKQWAEYYKDMGIWVFPFNQIGFTWKEWRNKSKEAYEKEFCSYDWDNAKKILMVVGGTKRKRVLIINGLKGKRMDYVGDLLQKTLKELGLLPDYPWVIWGGSYIGILVDTQGDISGMDNDKASTKRVRLIWEKSMTMPYSNSPVEFWHGERPKTRPAQIPSERLVECAKTFQEKYITPRVTKPEEPAEVKYAVRTARHISRKTVGTIALGLGLVAVGLLIKCSR